MTTEPSGKAGQSEFSVHSVESSSRVAAARTTVTLWIDTADFSGVHADHLKVDGNGAVDGHWLLDRYSSYGRPMTIEDFLSGRYFAATYHRERAGAIRAQRSRVTQRRDAMDRCLAELADARD